MFYDVEYVSVTNRMQHKVNLKWSLPNLNLEFFSSSNSKFKYLISPSNYLFIAGGCSTHTFPKDFSTMLLIGWLVGWILWHINLCWLFNAKSIFIHINSSFKKIQFNISTQFNCQNYFYFKLFSSVKQFYFK